MPSKKLFLLIFGILFAVGLIAFAVFFANYKNIENDQADPKIITGQRATSTLKFITIVSRHGNRRLYGFPNDQYPINDTRFWPFTTGQLTIQGRIQMYKLGKKIRSLYNGYLNSDISEIHATSTKMDRTVMSAQLFLAGLYPPQGVYIWNKEIPWQPIPVYTDSLDNTNRVLECPKFLQESLKREEKFRFDFAVQLKSVQIYLSKYAGTSCSYCVWDSFISEEFEGYELPEWSKEVYPQPMKDLAEKDMIAYLGVSDEMVRLRMGLFIRDMMGVMKSKLNGTLSPDRKINYYSGHDASLFGLQVVLGIPQHDVIALVKPGSAMVFEIHQNPNSSVYTVQVLYIDGGASNLDLRILRIPDCPDPCDFTKLAEITSKFESAIDFVEDCKLTNSTNF